MAKQLVLKGDTSRIEYIFIQDSSSTTGAGRTGLVFNTASLAAYYVRTQGSATAITLATQTVTGAFSSGGFVEVDATNMPGVYRFDPPDACFASGVDKVVIELKGASNMAPVVLEYQLVNFDPESTSLGLSNVSANVAQWNGSAVATPTVAGVPEVDVTHWIGTAAATPTVAGVPEVDVTHWLGTAAATPTVAGVPEVDITHFGGSAGTFASGRPEVNTTHAAGTAWASGAITEAALAADARTRIQTECEEALQAYNLDHLVGTAAGIPAVPAGTFLDQIMDDGTAAYDRTTDSLQAIRDASASLTDLGIIASTTIATLASQTSFTLTAGSADNSAYLYCRVIITDATTAVQKALGKISAYVGATKTVTLEADPGIFTMAAGDLITILPPAALTANAVGTGEFTQGAADKVWSTAARALTDKSDFRLSTTGVADVWAYVIEGTWTAVQFMRLFAAALISKCSGMGTTTAVFRDVDDSKNRLSVTVDADGNRSAFGTRDGT